MMFLKREEKTALLYSFFCSVRDLCRSVSFGVSSCIFIIFTNSSRFALVNENKILFYRLVHIVHTLCDKGP
jgi:hypothetical protein